MYNHCEIHSYKTECVLTMEIVFPCEDKLLIMSSLTSYSMMKTLRKKNQFLQIPCATKDRKRFSIFVCRSFNASAAFPLKYLGNGLF